MDATLTAFFEPSPGLRPPYPSGGRGRSDAAGEGQPAQCRFPARYAWLNEQFHFDSAQLLPADCSRFQKWKDQDPALRTSGAPVSISLIFASYYMNNPASTYGHTFLRLNGKSHASNENLLDYVVNFAADLESDNGVLFALKGLAGGYHGRFSTFPYYVKVQEYNNLESRDLWEYDLNVSSGNVDRLLQHLWELGNVRLRYFFFNKNCSYYLMPVLDVMDPNLSVSRPFIFKAIPDRYGPRGDPSARNAGRRVVPTQPCDENDRRAKAPVSGGNPSWRNGRQKILRRSRQTDLEDLLQNVGRLLLDSAYDLFRYHVGFNRDQPKEILEKEQKLLIFRSQIKLSSPAVSGGGPIKSIPGSPTKTLGDDGVVGRLPDSGS